MYCVIHMCIEFRSPGNLIKTNTLTLTKLRSCHGLFFLFSGKCYGALLYDITTRDVMSL